MKSSTTQLEGLRVVGDTKGGVPLLQGASGLASWNPVPTPVTGVETGEEMPATHPAVSMGLGDKGESP